MSLWDAFRNYIVGGVVQQPAPVPPPAPTFTPSFEEHTYSMIDGNHPGQYLTGRVNPMDYADFSTTLRLCQIFANYGPTITMIAVDPGFAVNAPQAYALKLSDGTVINAGLIAWAWIVNSDYNTALAYATRELVGDQAAHAAGGKQ